MTPEAEKPKQTNWPSYSIFSLLMIFYILETYSRLCEDNASVCWDQVWLVKSGEENNEDSNLSAMVQVTTHVLIIYSHLIALFAYMLPNISPKKQ